MRPQARADPPPSAGARPLRRCRCRGTRAYIVPARGRATIRPHPFASPGRREFARIINRDVAGCLVVAAKAERADGWLPPRKSIALGIFDRRPGSWVRL